MSIISYAQNYEDIMLWRALRHVGTGYYIDVGAWLPDTDSVTKLFYLMGWNGINIEPNPVFYAKLEAVRNRDTNLCVAIGEEVSWRNMNFIEKSGLSTLDNDLAREYSNKGLDVISKTVDVTTLSVVWSDFVPKGQDVHFLKIDVEGCEADVLNGNNWKLYRPWIVVIESISPISQSDSFHEWEEFLLSKEYLFVYADGLNRFYVANEHNELMKFFQYPPNIFDDFYSSHLEKALYENKRYLKQYHELSVEHHELSVEHHELSVEHHELSVEHHELSVEHHELSVGSYVATESHSYKKIVGKMPGHFQRLCMLIMALFKRIYK